MIPGVLTGLTLIAFGVTFGEATRSETDNLTDTIGCYLGILMFCGVGYFLLVAALVTGH